MTPTQRKAVRRRQVLNQSGWRCVYCSKPLHRYTATIDHVWPKALGGTKARANCVAACQPCNVAKAHKPLGVWQPPNPLPLLKALPRPLLAHAVREDVACPP